MIFSDNININEHAQLSTADAAACLHLDIYIFDADAGAEIRAPPVNGQFRPQQCGPGPAQQPPRS